MSPTLLDLPNELLAVIAFHLIDGAWSNDVGDFLSLTSTCRRLHALCRAEKCWRKMAVRRDPTSEKPSDMQTWLDYCKESKTVFQTNDSSPVGKISLSDADHFAE
jgi:hypothetical protein